MRHDRPGLLSMGSRGPDTNSSQVSCFLFPAFYAFYCCFRFYCCFGFVNVNVSVAMIALFGIWVCLYSRWSFPDSRCRLLGAEQAYIQPCLGANAYIRGKALRLVAQRQQILEDVDPEHSRSRWVVLYAFASLLQFRGTEKAYIHAYSAASVMAQQMDHG